jgi:hypothetical protein
MEHLYRLFPATDSVVGLERGALSLVSTIEELLERKSSGSGLESREYGRWDPSRWPGGTLYPQKLALTSLTSSGRSVGIVRSRTQAMEFSLVPGHRSRSSGFDSLCCQMFWEVVCLERGPLSLVSTIEELLERKSCGSDLGSREYGRGDPLRWLHNTLYPRSLGRYSSLADSGHGVLVLILESTAFHVFYILLLWRWRQHVLPKRQ